MGGGRRGTARSPRHRLRGLAGMPHWQSIPSTWDSVWHANTIRWILDTGQASPTHMGELRNVETKAPLYYPSAFHALGAVLAQLTGSAPTTAYTLSSLAAAVWLFPLSAGLLTWQLLNGRTTLWRTAGASATAAALSASFTAVPYVEFDTAAMPNLVAYGLAVPTFVLVTSSLAHRWRIPLAVLATVGVFSVHITGGVVVVTFVTAWWLLTRQESRGRSREQRTAQRFPDAPGHRGSDAGGTAPAIPRGPAAGRNHHRTYIRHAHGQEAGVIRRDRPAHPPLERLSDPEHHHRTSRHRLPHAACQAHLVAGCGLATADCLDRALLGAIRRSDRCPDR